MSRLETIDERRGLFDHCIEFMVYIRSTTIKHCLTLVNNFYWELTEN